MSRSGYTDDFDDNCRLIMYPGAVTSALRGGRGQKALKEILSALDAMPEKWLAADSLKTEDGGYCTLGVLGAARGIDMSNLDPYECEEVARAFGIAPAMVREIAYENDEGGSWRPFHEQETGEERWARMRQWIASQIKEEPK